MKVGLKNLETGELEFATFFNGIAHMMEAMECLKAKGLWNHVAILSDYQELPHYFDDAPMYACRHKKGVILEPWCDSPGQVKRRFATNPRRTWTGYEELLHPENWHMIDHQGIKVLEGKTRHFDVPQEAGIWAFMQSNAGLTYAFTGADGKAWRKSLKAIYSFVSGRHLPKKGSFLAETLGDGTFKKRDDLDPWM